MAEIINVYALVDTPEETGSEVIKEGQMFGVPFKIVRIKVCNAPTEVTLHKDSKKPQEPSTSEKELQK